jgi:hypothetical protein
MAWIFDGKHFGGYTYEHWFDEDSAPDTENPDAETQTPAEAGEDSGGKRKSVSNHARTLPMEGLPGEMPFDGSRNTPQSD